EVGVVAGGVDQHVGTAGRRPQVGVGGEAGGRRERPGNPEVGADLARARTVRPQVNVKSRDGRRGRPAAGPPGAPPGGPPGPRPPQNPKRVSPPGSTPRTTTAERGSMRYTCHGGGPCEGALNGAVMPVPVSSGSAGQPPSAQARAARATSSGSVTRAASPSTTT